MRFWRMQDVFNSCEIYLVLNIISNYYEQIDRWWSAIFNIYLKISL